MRQSSTFVRLVRHQMTDKRLTAPVLLGLMVFAHSFPVFAQPSDAPTNALGLRTGRETSKSSALSPTGASDSSKSMSSAPMAPNRSPSSTSALKVGTGSQRVPAGSLLTVTFQTPLDSKTSNQGDPFIAYLSKDFTLAGDTPGTSRIILPSGTVVRGRINDVTRPGLFSHGGAMTLAFDHAMLPSGDLMPLTLNLAAQNDMVNKQGALYSDPGIGKKMQKGVQQGKTVFGDITDKGYQTGKNIAGGFGSIITVPAAVIGGAVAGTAVTTGKAAVAIVGRGDSVTIKPGDTLTIDFGGSFNLPSE